MHLSWPGVPCRWGPEPPTGAIGSQGALRAGLRARPAPGPRFCSDPGRRRGFPPGGGGRTRVHIRFAGCAGGSDCTRAARVGASPGACGRSPRRVSGRGQRPCPPPTFPGCVQLQGHKEPISTRVSPATARPLHACRGGLVLSGRPSESFTPGRVSRTPQGVEGSLLQWLSGGRGH